MTRLATYIILAGLAIDIPLFTLNYQKEQRTSVTYERTGIVERVLEDDYVADTRCDVRVPGLELLVTYRGSQCPEQGTAVNVKYRTMEDLLNRPRVEGISLKRP